VSPAVSLPMPTITLTAETMSALGVSEDDLRQSPLPGHARCALEAMLTARGFDMAKPIRTVELATGGFVLAQ
jgi:hypothetical protein